MDESIITALASGIEAEIQRLPNYKASTLYGTFEYTKTGNNYCHPVTWGLIAKVLNSLDGISYVGIDVRLNRKGESKFQPDLVGFDGSNNPVIYIDFESPNSSDARIVEKDIRPYMKWIGNRPGAAAPYVIVTSLPNCSRDGSEWEIRWIRRGQYNEAHAGKKVQILANPFRYWSSYWDSQMSKQDRGKLSLVYFINLDRGMVYPFSLGEGLPRKSATRHN